MHRKLTVIFALLVLFVGTFTTNTAVAAPLTNDYVDTITLDPIPTDTVIPEPVNDFWSRVVGITFSYTECQLVLWQRILRYGKPGLCVPDPKGRGTWLVMLR
ncbi:Uncharacterised protein [Corynebacterium kutscheri]|uniref:Uncharacterized protein n=1 Tax=Corynebacterium kutscheri TaxID=35755 RepID=A0AB38VVN8_9CORY|nr:Uncharacterised protein [Corynebacterium kutscheri]VEH81647.1 Uncharacterised protein [Corynebacterium kutscheri]